MLRAEVYAHAMRASQNRKKEVRREKKVLSRPVGCPQMTWERALENAVKSKGISKEIDEWFAIVKDRPKWRLQLL